MQTCSRLKMFGWVPYFAVAAVLITVQCAAYGEQTDDSALVQLRGQHAISALFGLPAVAARPVQTSEWQFSLEHSNQYMGGVSGGQALLLDGETSELTLRHRQRIGACAQLETVVPFIQHSGGSFDKAIDKWHSIFGLPDAHRSEAPYGALSYAYTNSDGVNVRIDSAQSGIGDIQISLQRSLGCYATADATGAGPIARIGVKLPTGKLEELTGSGEFDYFADIQSPVLSRVDKWRIGAALGALYMGRAELLPNQKTLVAYGTFGVHYVLSSRIRLLSQLDWHTPFYQSELRELGLTAITLTAGVRFSGPLGQTFDFSISEDAAIDTTPDIVVRLSWAYRPLAGR